MYESHASYGRAASGRPGPIGWWSWCDAEGPAAGLYGARITGGGSGGTVAVLGRRDAAAAIARVADAYERADRLSAVRLCGFVAGRGWRSAADQSSSD